MINPEELKLNAKYFIEQVNKSNIPNLGAIVLFFDTVHGNPAIAVNVERDKVISILTEILRALPSLPVQEERGN